jgi:DNA-directed RNA polymerase subunit RPC12/RpoP
VKAARSRDRPCDYPGCTELVLRVSQYCRHHLGVVHGGATARTFRCSKACQAVHARCPRCRCLCNGAHARHLRDGVCYQAGAPSCWSALHAGAGDHLDLWVATCLMCSRTSDWLVAPPPPGTSCPQCGSRMLDVERTRVTAGIRLLSKRIRDTADFESAMSRIV